MASRYIRKTVLVIYFVSNYALCADSFNFCHEGEITKSISSGTYGVELIGFMGKYGLPQEWKFIPERRFAVLTYALGHLRCIYIFDGLKLSGWIKRTDLLAGD